MPRVHLARRIADHFAGILLEWTRRHVVVRLGTATSTWVGLGSSHRRTGAALPESRPGRRQTKELMREQRRWVAHATRVGPDLRAAAWRGRPAPPTTHPAGPGSGINHFDVAASYGDAELRLARDGSHPGADLPGYQTGLRAGRAPGPRSTQLGATADRSCSLIHGHAVGDTRIWTWSPPPGIAGGGGPARTRGWPPHRDHGHGHQARRPPGGLGRFPFDTVLTRSTGCWARPGIWPTTRPWSPRSRPRTRPDDLKVASRRNWPEPRGTATRPGTSRSTTRSESVPRAWVLSHPEVTGCHPGDVRLLPLLIEAERRPARSA